MPIRIDDKVNCTGCAACQNICPKRCISMVSDNSGFEYPIVNNTACIECDLCKKICPIISPSKLAKNDPIAIYAGWSKSDDLRYLSTSGGIFSELASSILDAQGAVVGAAYDSDNSIEHIIVSRTEDLELLRQSKYAQSKIGDIYSRVKEKLKQSPVLFCGSPCQVAGLLSYLGKRYDNLYTVDFICRGMNSPKAYKAWLQEIENKEKAKVIRVWFKYKEDGWKKSPRCTRIDLSNGKFIVQKGDLNPFMHGYLGPNLYIRPSCSNCQFKGFKRYSDITVGDFWKIDPSLDDDKGTSMIQINSDKGRQLLNSIKDRVFLHECSQEDITRGNVMMDESVVINKNSERFLSEIGQNKSFSKLVEKYTERSVLQRAKYNMKKILIKMNLR